MPSISHAANIGASSPVEGVAVSSAAGGGAVIFKEEGTKLSGKQATVIAFYEYVGKKRGITYVFTDALGKEFGGEYSDDVITISISSTASMTAAAGHELGHYLEEHFEKEYKELKEYVKQALEANGENVAMQIIHIQDLYEKSTGQKLSADEALSEIVNNSLFSVDIASADFEQFIKEHTSLAEAIADKLLQFLKDLESFFRNVNDIKEVKTLRADAEYLQEVADRVSDILAKEQKNSTTEGGVKFLAKDSNDSETARIRAIIKENTEQLNNMNVVIDAKTPKHFSTAKEAYKWAISILNKTGFQVDRQNFGVITFSKKKINTSIDYLNTNEERAALAALPRVLKRGKVVFYNPNHKGREFGSFIIAAPVKINGQRGNMAVAVSQTKGYVYKTHRILLPNGKSFVFLDDEKTEPTPLRGYTENSAHAATIGSVTDSISDSSEKSNSKKQVLDTDYMQAVNSGNEQEQQRLLDEAAKDWGAYAGKDGKPIYFYHQTAEDFTVFDTSRPGAGKSDYETPSGIFIKPHNRDIGLKGKKQMPLFAFIKNPLVFKDRAAAARYYSQHVKGYADIVAEISSIDNRFSQMYNELDKALDEEYIKYRKARIEGRISKTEYKKRIDEAQKKADVLFEKWEEASNRAGEQAKELITAYFGKSDFDAVIIEKDAGSFGRSTETFIVFDSSQVKSADPVTYDDNGDVIPLSERFSGSKDIRYSVKDIEDFDETGYNVINTTGKRSYGDLKREVMTWDADRYLDKVRCIHLGLSNRFYIYKTLSNEQRDIIIYRPNTKLARSNYNEIRRAFNRGFNGHPVSVSTLIRSIRNNSDDDSDLSRNEQREFSINDRVDNRPLRKERQGDGRGTVENDSNDNLPKRAKQLVYDYSIDDRIKQQEVEMAKISREAGVYTTARKNLVSAGDKIAYIRREMTKTMDMVAYMPGKVEKVADDFLAKYRVSDLDENEKQAFLRALHNMYRAIDGEHGFGYFDDNGKYHKEPSPCIME